MDKIIESEEIINSTEEMIAAGERFGENLSSCVVLMKGLAGAGKTHFVKGVAKALSIKEQIVSPTYSLRIEYEGRLKLVHIDAYRLESVEEAYESGVLEELSETGTVAFIEWAELIESEITYPHFEIDIDYLSADTRKLSIYSVK